jgi:hypothetical protein
MADAAHFGNCACPHDPTSGFSSASIREASSHALIMRPSNDQPAMVLEAGLTAFVSVARCAPMSLVRPKIGFEPLTSRLPPC